MPRIKILLPVLIVIVATLAFSDVRSGNAGCVKSRPVYRSTECVYSRPVVIADSCGCWGPIVDFFYPNKSEEYYLQKWRAEDRAWNNLWGFNSPGRY